MSGPRKKQRRAKERHERTARAAVIEDHPRSVRGPVVAYGRQYPRCAWRPRPAVRMNLCFGEQTVKTRFPHFLRKQSVRDRLEAGSYLIRSGSAKV